MITGKKREWEKKQPKLPLLCAINELEQWKIEDTPWQIISRKINEGQDRNSTPRLMVERGKGHGWGEIISKTKWYEVFSVYFFYIVQQYPCYCVLEEHNYMVILAKSFFFFARYVGRGEIFFYWIYFVLKNRYEKNDSFWYFSVWHYGII